MKEIIEKLLKNKKLLITILIVFTFIVSVSYAMYNIVLQGQRTHSITTSKLSFSYKEPLEALDLLAYEALTDEEGKAQDSYYEFTVKAESDAAEVINYVVYLQKETSTKSFSSSDIKVYLTSVSNNVETEVLKPTLISSLSEFNDTENTSALYGSNFTFTNTDLGKKETTYRLRIWLREGFDFSDYITNKTTNGEQNIKLDSYEYKFKVNVATGEMPIKILCDEMPAENTSANVPSLAKNMIPVCYDSTNNVWLKADRANTNSNYRWYSYSGKTWANAVTVTAVDGSRDDLVDAEVGTVIPMDRINTMWVWIPRFIATGDTANYNGGTIDAPGAFNITFVDKETAAHDAFDFGGAISGFWIGKFENSSDTNCSPGIYSAVGAGCNLTNIRPKILPNATSWCGASVSTFFYDILAMTESGNQYGFDKTKDTTLDTHMLKNNEWGAVAYLTQSIYGRCSSSTSCTEIGINNNSSYITGYGAPAGSEYQERDGYTYVEPQAYNTTQGMDASTTGNIYGVYDMSGGADEYVMGVYWDGTKYWSGYRTISNQHSGFNGCLGSSCSSTLETGVSYPSDNKYYNLYTTSTNYNSAGLQHGMTETSGWYGDIADFVSGRYPWVHRGGSYNTYSNAGVFTSIIDIGSATTYYGSRSLLEIN